MVQVKGFFIVDPRSGMIDKPVWALVETKRWGVVRHKEYYVATQDEREGQNWVLPVKNQKMDSCEAE